MNSSPNTSSDASPWRFDGRQAEIDHRRGTFALQADAPEMGLQFQSGDAGVVLATRFADSRRYRSTDCYVRGRDLILVYPQTSARPYNLQLQYAALLPGDIFSDKNVASQDAAAGNAPPVIGFELQISNYTFVLESYPSVDVVLFELQGDDTSPLQIFADPQNPEGVYCGDDVGLEPIATAATDGSRIAAAQSTRTLAGGTVHFTGLIHPSDQVDTQLLYTRGGDRDCDLMVQFFGRFMEKGVIRRGRLRLLISDDRLSDDQLLDAYKMFASSDLPLTA